MRPLRSPGPETEMNPPPMKSASPKSPHDKTRPLSRGNDNYLESHAIDEIEGILDE